MHPKVFDTIRLNLIVGDGHCKFSVIIAYIYSYQATGGTIRGSSSVRNKTFLFFKTSGSALGFTQAPIRWVSGFFQGIKWPDREVGHISPSDAEAENRWSYTPSPPLSLHGVDGEN